MGQARSREGEPILGTSPRAMPVRVPLDPNCITGRQLQRTLPPPDQLSLPFLLCFPQPNRNGNESNWATLHKKWP